MSTLLQLAAAFLLAFLISCAGLSLWEFCRDANRQINRGDDEQ
jgi:hypothetical protein